MAELLGRVERMALSNTGQANVGQRARSSRTAFADLSSLQVAGAVPTDVARVQDINRVINSNAEMTRLIQSYA